MTIRRGLKPHFLHKTRPCPCRRGPHRTGADATEKFGRVSLYDPQGKVLGDYGNGGANRGGTTEFGRIRSALDVA